MFRQIWQSIGCSLSPDSEDGLPVSADGQWHTDTQPAILDGAERLLEGIASTVGVM
jgi:hypothetical protein